MNSIISKKSDDVNPFSVCEDAKSYDDEILSKSNLKYQGEVAIDSFF